MAGQSGQDTRKGENLLQTPEQVKKQKKPTHFNKAEVCLTWCLSFAAVGQLPTGWLGLRADADQSDQAL